MNLKTLRTQARLKSSVSNSADYSTTNLNQQLNIAYDILSSVIANINEDFFEEQKVKFNLALNSGMYSLPTDCLKFKQLRLAYATPSTEDDYSVARAYDPSSIDNVSVDETSAAATNPIVDITNNYFRIQPTPTSAITNGGEIYYIARPSALVNSGDTPIIPSEWHDLLAIYGGKEIAFSAGINERWQIMEAQWQKGIEKIKNSLAARNINDNARWRNILETTQNKVTRELY